MKIGIALAGGGARGAYQIGVWKALKENGLDKHVTTLSGASIGSINALLFAMDDFELAQHIWMSLEKDSLFHINKHTFQRLLDEKWKFFTRGVYDTREFEKMLDEHINPNLIKDKKVYIATTAIGGMKRKFIRMLKVNFKYHFKHEKQNLVFHDAQSFTKQKLKKVILASCAIPVVFKPIQLDGETYYDGGILNNVPSLPLEDCDCDKVLIIDLFRINFKRKKSLEDKRFKVIYPSKGLGGILDFSPNKTEKRIHLGYQDALTFIEENIDFFKEK